ncbi:MAG: hypothetical protein IJJ33_19565 [Victivallales bacterium]|nr:hypothetical protein [Victivallales bacterium]
MTLCYSVAGVLPFAAVSGVGLVKAKKSIMHCEERFAEIYHSEPEGVAFCPYRVCPVGAHSDTQHGRITGLALDKGIHLAYRPKRNGVIELASLNFDKRAQFHVAGVPRERQSDWADYLRGATLALAERWPLTMGLAGVIEGSLPVGGLSSSSAVIIAFLKALCTVNGIRLDEQELVAMCMDAENNYVGVSSGKLDPSCETFCRKDRLLYLDTLDDTRELVSAPANMPPWRIAVFFSGLERSLVGTAFNMRVDECRSAAYALLAYAGLPYGKFRETHLRDVPREVFEQYRGRLPENWRKRALHWYDEQERVLQSVEAWRQGDLVKYGRLSFESGKSSIENWQTGSPELKELYSIMTHVDGIYGGRFSGAGFRGCCMALYHPDYEESIREQVTREYLAVFPALKGKFSVHCCASADGIGAWSLSSGSSPSSSQQ